MSHSPPLSRHISRRSEESKGGGLPDGVLTVFAPIAIAIETKSRNFEAFRTLLTDYIYGELVAYEKQRALRFFLVFEKLVLLNSVNLPPPNSALQVAFRTPGQIL